MKTELTTVLRWGRPAKPNPSHGWPINPNAPIEIGMFTRWRGEWPIDSHAPMILTTRSYRFQSATIKGPRP